MYFSKALFEDLADMKTKKKSRLRVIQESLSRNLDKNAFTAETNPVLIEKVKLKKFGKGAFIDITANGKKYHWTVRGIPGIKNFKIEDLKRILRHIFQEKLVA